MVAVELIGRSIWFPYSAAGVMAPSLYRSLELAGWVIFEDVFLFVSILQINHQNMAAAQARNSAEMGKTSPVKFQDVGEMLERANAEIAQVRAALDQHAIVSIADVKGKITFVNDKFCSVSKYAREELIGQDHRIVNSACHSKEFMRDLWRTIATGQVWHGEVKNRAKDGSYYWVATTIVPFLDRTGKPFQYVSIRTDITYQKTNEIKQECLVLELDRSNRELSDFAYVVSHDLKAPLRGVSSIATFIARDYADKIDEDGREQLALLVQRMGRMHRLIEAILQVAKVGREHLKTSKVDLRSEVSSLVEFLSIPDSIVTSIDMPLPTIIIEEVYINQVFQNLLSNAVKYMDKPHGEIHVGYRKNSGYLEFYVKDTGPGIHEKYHKKIFQLFQTLQARDDLESTGVGLALIRKIVEGKQGNVWVDSVVGEGSTFWFSLPDSLLVKEVSEQLPSGPRAIEV
jgi:PAS domain S-box-containing protein